MDSSTTRLADTVSRMQDALEHPTLYSPSLRARIAAEMDARTSYRAEYQRRADDVAVEIATLQQRIQAAGGIKADRLAAAGIVAEVGDLVKIHGFIGRVMRVNPRTYTVDVGCDYTERDGRSTDTMRPSSPQAAQGALFEVWGAGIVAAPQDH